MDGREQLTGVTDKMSDKVHSKECNLVDDHAGRCGQFSEAVNHPKHYEKPSGVECITVVEHLNFNIGNAIKYLWRAGSKGALIEDLEKARWYCDREINRLKEFRSELVPKD